VRVENIEPKMYCPCPPMFQKLAVNGMMIATETINSGMVSFRVAMIP